MRSRILEKQKLLKFAKDYFEWWYKVSPVTATSLGIHQDDNRLADFSAEAIKKEVAEMRDFLKKLKKIDKVRLSVFDQTDYELLLGDLIWSIEEMEKIKYWQTNPGLYVDEIIWGLFFLISRQFAPVSKRALNLLERMRVAEKVLNDGKKNVKNPPKVFVEVATESTGGGIVFLKTAVVEFSKKVKDPELRKEILNETNNLILNFKDYLLHLKKLKIRAKGKFPIGRALFEKKLKYHQGFDFTTDELLKLGWQVFEETEGKMKKLAEKIESGKSWPEVIKRLQARYPREKELLLVYKKEIKKLKNFLSKSKVMPLPQGESLVVMDTPESDRATTPYAAYLAPAPFEKEQRGQFWVTPLDKKLSKSDKIRQLKEHALWHLPVTVLHESYPGHHLQLCFANKVKSKIRKHFANTPYCEGWALYCEQLMDEVGYLSDDRQKLFRLKDNLWRAARVILDVSLHTGKMSIDEAVKFFVEKVHLAPSSALAEVRRYTLSPTYPLSYMVGKLEILKLREEMKQRLVKKFSLYKFHQAFLERGTIPLKLARREMINKLKT
jgi:uncharacterized protein (DUF885 family)